MTKAQKDYITNAIYEAKREALEMRERADRLYNEMDALELLVSKLETTD